MTERDPKQQPQTDEDEYPQTIHTPTADDGTNGPSGVDGSFYKSEPDEDPPGYVPINPNGGHADDGTTRG